MDATFERSPDTDAVARVLRGVNQDISYATLAKGADLSLVRMKQVLTSARRILRNSDQLLFGTVRGWGLKRLTDEDKVRKSGDRRKRLARSAHQGIKDLDTIQAYDRLAPSDQLVVTTNRTIFALAKQQLATPTRMPSAPRQNTTAPDTSNLVGIESRLKR